MKFQVGDVVRRIAPFGHEHHRAGDVCTIAWISENGNGNYFHDGLNRETAYGSLIMFKLMNYELVSRGPVEKKRSGFGKWYASQK